MRALVIGLLLSASPALAGERFPDPLKNYMAYERATNGQFKCDDRPTSCEDADPGVPWSCEDHLAEREPPLVGCISEITNRAWDGYNYQPFCNGSWARPRITDPWVINQRRRGFSLDEAQIFVSINRTNGCDR